MSLEARLRGAVKQAVELQQALEQMSDHVPPPLREKAARLEERADRLATAIARLLHDVEQLRGEP